MIVVLKGSTLMSFNLESGHITVHFVTWQNYILPVFLIIHINTVYILNFWPCAIIVFRWGTFHYSASFTMDTSIHKRDIFIPVQLRPPFPEVAQLGENFAIQWNVFATNKSEIFTLPQRYHLINLLGRTTFS